MLPTKRLMNMTATALTLVLLATADFANASGASLFLPSGSGETERAVANLAAAGSFGQALLRLRTTSGSAADRARNLILKAQIEDAMGDAGKATADIEAAWKTGTLDNATLAWALGYLQYESNSNECLKMCEKLATSNKPSEVSWAYFIKARMHSRRGETAAAVKSYEAAMKTNHAGSGAFLEIGDYYITAGKYEQAVEAASKALSLVQNEPSHRKLIGALQTRAKAYTKLKRYKDALADYNRAIPLGPLVRELYVGRAEVYKAIGDKAKADADLAHLRVLDNSY